MSIIPINNSNKNINLDFSDLEEWRKKRIDFIIELLRDGDDENNTHKNGKRHRSTSTSDINMNNPEVRKNLEIRPT